MLEFRISLKDNVSHDAKTIADSLTSLEKHIRSLGLGVDKLSVNLGSKLSKSLKSGVEESASSLSSMTSSLSELLAAPEITIPLAVAGAGIAGLGAVLYEGSKRAIEANDALDDLKASIKGMTGFDDIGVDKLVSQLDDLSKELPQTRAELGELATQLLGAGISADDLSGRLKAISSAQALMGARGKEAAQKVTELFEKISESEKLGTTLKVNEKLFQGIGVSAEDVAKKMGISSNEILKMLKSGEVDAKKFGDALQSALIEKGGDALENMMYDVDTLKRKFSEAFLKIFQSPELSSAIEGVGKMVAKFLDLFDQGTTSGRVLHTVVTSVFSSLFRTLSKVLPYAYLFFLKLETAMLKIYIALKPLTRRMMDFGKSVDVSTIDAFMDGVVSVLVAVGESLAFVIKLVMSFVSGIQSFFGTIEQIGSKISSVLQGIFSPDIGSSLSGALIDGMVSGLTAGARRVADAVSGIAKGAIKSAKSLLGISSPSREMMKLGSFTAEGFAAGVDKSASLVQAASQSLAFNAKAGAAAPMGGSSGGGLSVIFQSGAIQVTSAGQGALELTEEALSLALEKIAIEQGLISP